MIKIDSTTWRAARRALERAIALYVEDPGVAFIDLGLSAEKPEPPIAVRIHRRHHSGHNRKTAVRLSDLPDLGFPVEWRDCHFRFHLQQRTTRTSQSICQELCGGAPVVNSAGRIFTLGGMVRDRQTGHVMMLSSWHVLAGAWAMGENVLISRRISAAGAETNEVVAEFTRNAMSHGLDAAVSQLKRPTPFRSEQQGIGAIAGVVLPQLGMPVIKAGAGTGVTSGRITGILGYSMQRYANRKQLIGPLVYIAPENPEQEVSAPGDSGAWWLENATRRAVALHFAGSDAPNFALAFSMPEVLEALAVDIDTTPAVTTAAANPTQFSQQAAPEKPGVSAELPPEPPVTAPVSATEAALADTPGIESLIKDMITTADFTVISVIDQKAEKLPRILISNVFKFILTKLAKLAATLKTRVLYRFVQATFVLLVAMMMIAFDRHVKENRMNQNAQIGQLQKDLQHVRTLATVDSVRQQQINRIVVIIDRFNPEMNSEMKFNLAAEIYLMSLKYHQLDVDLICATITHESAKTWDPEVVSFAGAMGLMQILPSTGVQLAREEGLTWTSTEDILFNPIYNVRLGCRYLAMLVSEYGLEAGLAGYNGGDRQARHWRRGGRADSLLHPETAYYVPAILKIYREYRSLRL